MFMFAPPTRIRTEVHFRLPDRFRTKARTDWSEPNRLGQEVDCFIEGPSFDRDGNLYFVDIPFGQPSYCTTRSHAPLGERRKMRPNGMSTK